MHYNWAGNQTSPVIRSQNQTGSLPLVNKKIFSLGIDRQHLQERHNKWHLEHAQECNFKDNFKE